MSIKQKYNKSEIILLASVFRDAIVVSRDLLSLQFMKFPKAACRAASEVLAIYFYKIGFNKIVLYSGSINKSADSTSHTWIEVCDLVVDITADQFEDKFKNSKFGIKKSIEVTNQKELWHNHFNSNLRPTGLDEYLNRYTERVQSQILPDYNKISQYLPEQYKPMQ